MTVIRTQRDENHSRGCKCSNSEEHRAFEEERGGTREKTKKKRGVFLLIKLLDTGWFCSRSRPFDNKDKTGQRGPVG